MARCSIFFRYLLHLGDSSVDADEDEAGEEEGERRFDFLFDFERFLCFFVFLSGVTFAIAEFLCAAARLLTLAVAAWAA